MEDIIQKERNDIQWEEIGRDSYETFEYERKLERERKQRDQILENIEKEWERKEERKQERERQERKEEKRRQKERIIEQQTSLNEQNSRQINQLSQIILQQRQSIEEQNNRYQKAIEEQNNRIQRLKEEQNSKKIYQLKQTMGEFNEKISKIEKELSEIAGMKEQINSFTDVFAKAGSYEAEELIKKAKKEITTAIDIQNAFILRAPISFFLGIDDKTEVYVKKYGALNKYPEQFLEWKAENYMGICGPAGIQSFEEFEKNMSEIPKNKLIFYPINPKYRTATLYTKTISDFEDIIELPVLGKYPQLMRCASGPAINYREWLYSNEKIDRSTGLQAEMEKCRIEANKILSEVKRYS